MGNIALITNNIQIKKKLILSYLLVVFVPVLTVGLLLTESLKDMAIEHAVQQSINNVEKIKKQVEETLKILTDISNKVYFDKQLKALVSKEYESNLEVFRAYSEYTDLTDYMLLYKEISGIRFYTMNATLLENWSIFHLSTSMLKEPWYMDAIENRGKIGWYYIPDQTKQGLNYVSLVRPIYYSNMTLCGMLVITINPQNLHATINQEPFETMILSDQDEVLAAKDQTLVGSSLKQLQLVDSFGSQAIKVEDSNYQGKQVKIINQSIFPENSNNSLRIISVIPLETILKESQHISYIAYWIIFSSLLLSIFFILFFSSAMTKRIGVLIRDIRMVARGDLTHSSVVQGKDEIGQLSHHFNHMVTSIDDLMKRVEEAQREQHALELKQREIKFKMLVNQVNPHFLFNVLETIRMKAVCQEEEEIAYSVKALGKLLRHNLEIGHEAVSLLSEIEMIHIYLEIQKFRFGDKLNYELPNQTEAGGIMILPMLLQPIVENAIIHGIENKIGKGTVSVQIQYEGSTIKLSVSDNGIGIEADKCKEIMATLHNPEDEQGQRIGLRNVHQRIKHYYGAEYGLDLSSHPKLGTRISIIIPIGGKEDV
ncbi:MULTISPECIES: sensor histidine kinase [unclassified Paenibacillus]|uniref:sensor histidine kinase n=1 Tax=unclassified Paenibacillus TaxID=185978 RepID=UPI0027874554|nr:MULTISPECIES: sensor histidine kinase [unclassified Paenibacillus]MDQ0903546.1 two-component system sensor histidine kinase YesM [Paenibacillus sp. V4I7]MDQ0917976.1 two-component system sensor histidine kinase YesM [Paenibacillus sp. V4I5]